MVGNGGQKKMADTGTSNVNVQQITVKRSAHTQAALKKLQVDVKSWSASSMPSKRMLGGTR